MEKKPLNYGIEPRTYGKEPLMYGKEPLIVVRKEKIALAIADSRFLVARLPIHTGHSRTQYTNYYRGRGPRCSASGASRVHARKRSPQPQRYICICPPARTSDSVRIVIPATRSARRAWSLVLVLALLVQTVVLVVLVDPRRHREHHCESSRGDASERRPRRGDCGLEDTQRLIRHCQRCRAVVDGVASHSSLSGGANGCRATCLSAWSILCA